MLSNVRINMAGASLVLGILPILMFPIMPGFAIIFPVFNLIGLILGVLSITRKGPISKIGIAGIILNSIELIAAIILTILIGRGL